MTLFLDACVIIYWIEAAEPFHSRVIAQLNVLRTKLNAASFAVSRLSVLECLVKPIRESDTELESDYQNFFQAGDLRVVELTADVIEVATQLRAHYALMTPDALQLASAMSLGDDFVFLTNDKRLRKVQEVHIEIIA